MLIPVPEKYPPCTAGVILLPQKGRCQDHKSCADPCRKPVEDVIQFCGTAPVILISFIMISHHGIHGVHRLVQHPQGRSPKAGIQQRCDNAVGGILRHGFHCRPRHSGLIQGLRIPSHDHGDCFPCRHDISLPKRPVHPHALHTKALRRQAVAGENDFRHYPAYGMNHIT